MVTSSNYVERARRGNGPEVKFVAMMPEYGHARIRVWNLDEDSTDYLDDDLCASVHWIG